MSYPSAPETTVSVPLFSGPYFKRGDYLYMNGHRVGRVTDTSESTLTFRPLLHVAFFEHWWARLEDWCWNTPIWKQKAYACAIGLATGSALALLALRWLS